MWYEFLNNSSDRFNSLSDKKGSTMSVLSILGIVIGGIVLLGLGVVFGIAIFMAGVLKFFEPYGGVSKKKSWVKRLFD